MSSPRLSIGLPVFNGEPYLSGALAAVLSQTFSDFELIIADNASTDGTADICRRAAAQDERIRYLRHAENRGAVFNLNYVLQQARAPLFKWVHADDLHASQCIEQCVAALSAAPEKVILAFPRTTIIDAQGQPLEDYRDDMDVREERPALRLEHVLRRLRLCNVLFGVFRRAALAACRPHARYPNADVALICELGLRGQLLEVPEARFFRRLHGGSSHHENVTYREIAIWMDPHNAGRPVLPRCRNLADILTAIRTVPMSWAERFRCMGALLSSG